MSREKEIHGVVRVGLVKGRMIDQSNALYYAEVDILIQKYVWSSSVRVLDLLSDAILVQIRSKNLEKNSICVENPTCISTTV